MQKQDRIRKKVRNINFYVDHPEISKLLNIIVVIYNQTRDRWTIIKHTEVTKPIDIALLQFTESTHELGNHYDALIIETQNHNW